ncbi:DoxX family protein (plasmid) [Cupriavidus necator]|jgi:putative oxidoreductase|uniref:DoxX family protein n=1 Tax=Cupriavidus necator TaxID=106590 RepID=A0A367PR31_CUPNE|nr:DoxX family protein [Cupriavidus necator]QQX89489.1 DoxX family protein [Cupriavidus necator]RCJ09375.1 DoxX family protein [Cupriavidus necator]
MIDNRTAPYAALLLRIALGVMFLAHGLTKLLVFTPAGTAGFFQSVGFPGFLAYPVIAFEILAGILLVLGVYARWVGAIAAVQLLVASTVHFGNGWSFTNTNGGWEYPVFLAMSALAVTLTGEGACALKPSKRN